MINGPVKKKGGRSIYDPKMQNDVLAKIKIFILKNRGVLPSVHQIRLLAMKFSNNKGFVASKGWCTKFLKRNERYFTIWRNEVPGFLS